MKARPKTYIMYRIATFLGDAEALISCYPQQKWDVNEKDGKHIKLSRKKYNFCDSERRF